MGSFAAPRGPRALAETDYSFRCAADPVGLLDVAGGGVDLAQEVANCVLELSIGLALTAVGRCRGTVIRVWARGPSKLVDAGFIHALDDVEVLTVDHHPLHEARLPIGGISGNGHRGLWPPQGN